LILSEKLLVVPKYSGLRRWRRTHVNRFEAFDEDVGVKPFRRNIEQIKLSATDGIADFLAFSRGGHTVECPCLESIGIGGIDLVFHLAK